MLAYNNVFFTHGIEGCEVLRSSCLYVCRTVYLSTRISQKPHVQTSRNLLYMLPVATAWSSSDHSAIQIHCALPVSWMTSCFHIMGQIQRGYWRIIHSDSIGGAEDVVCYPRTALYCISVYTTSLNRSAKHAKIQKNFALRQRVPSVVGDTSSVGDGLAGWPVTVGVVEVGVVSQPGAYAERYRCACLHCTQGLAGRGDGYQCDLDWGLSSDNHNLYRIVSYRYSKNTSALN